MRLAELNKVHPRGVSHTPETTGKTAFDLSQWTQGGQSDSETLDMMLQMLLKMREEQNDG